ncbi:MAG: PAS domain S-box protein [Bacteroidetes bacterium]|nr:PAS domain S-box protein [Bacteroidota bacterium]
MLNRIQLRIVLVALCLTGLFLAGFFMLKAWERNNLAKTMKEFQRQQLSMLRNVVSIRSESVKFFTIDYSQWDEMVTFIENHDQKWVEKNVLNILSNYGVDQLWVLNDQFDSVIYRTNNDAHGLGELLPDKGQLPLIVKENKFPHFFVTGKQGLIEIFGAPVQYQYDKPRITQARGWLFTGKQWDADELEKISDLTSSVLTLDTITMTRVEESKEITGTNDIEVSLVLEGWSSRPIAVLRSVAAFPFLQEYRLGFTRFTYISIFFAFILIIIVSILIFRSVEIPLRFLNKTLEMRDMKYLEPLKNQRNQFGKLSKLISGFFEQEALFHEIQKRKKLEIDLEQSERRYRLLVEKSPDVLWIANEMGNCIYLSSNVINVFGLQPEEIIDHENSWELFVHPDDYYEMNLKFSNFIVSGELYECEYRFLKKDMNYVWVSEKAISQFENDGEKFFCGRITDITHYKELEKKLFDSEQEFRVLFEQNPFGVGLVTLPDLRFVKVNKALCDMLGYTEKEMVKITIEEISAKDEFPGELEKARVMRADGDGRFSIEKKLKKKNGEWIWCHLTGSYIKDKKGNEVYSCGVIENITSKKITEDALKREHSLLLALMDNVPDPIFYKNREGVYINANKATIKLLESLGYENPIGKRDLEVFENQDIANHYRQDDINIFETGEPIINKEEQVVSKDGNVVWILTTKIPISIFSNENDVVVGILRIITEKKETELKLIQYAQELKESNSSKDKFMSILAHDLKNPFNAILGFSSVLSEEYDEYTDEERKHFISNIFHASENTFALIHNILEWSRAQTGRIEFKQEYHDLSTLVNETIKLLKPSIDAKKIHVSNGVPFNTQIFADENIIRTILRNMLSNSVKFTDPGGSVKLRVRSLNHDLLEVCIEDNGLGIPEDGLAKLFKIDEPYRREGTTGEQGTGLGLIICKEFVEKSGGMIWIESKEGVGTKFFFTMPTEKSG